MIGDPELEKHARPLAQALPDRERWELIVSEQWKSRVQKHYAAINNTDLLEIVLVMAERNYDEDDCWPVEEYEFEYVRNLLHERLADWLKQ